LDTNRTDAFMSGQKRILVFSEAGGTGRSYHADLSAPNRQRRSHYLVEPGWRADTAIQGLGRSHRTHQACPPLFRPVTTDIHGEKRFTSTIARRLDSLGALTRGERRTAGAGLFRAEDNLESPWARRALLVFYGALGFGDLSRQDAERRVWRETEADRFTAFDRRLLAAADADRCLDDGIGGTDAWTALTRERLRHLERLGLAVRSGRRFQLSTELEAKLRRLQLSKDVIRTLNQRRLEGARSTEQLGKTPVRGKVVKTGFHDEVRAADGSEHYGRLGVGKTAPAMGKTVTLSLDARGFAQVLPGKQLGHDMGR
jgi:hypothetical protein